MSDTDPSVPEAAPTGAAPESLFTSADVEARVASAVSAAVEAAAREAEEKALRIAAEYQNFRRRAEKDAELRTDEAVGRLASDLLAGLDLFEKALALRADPAAAVSGLESTDRLLRAALAKHGMTPLDPAGAPFDPKLHEAVARQPSKDHAPGTVLAVFEKGWMLRQRLLRPARVVVAAAPEA